MQVRGRIASLAVAATLVSTMAVAEDTAPGGVLGVSVGSRVRIKAPTLLKGGRIQGLVTASDERSLTLAPEGGLPIVVPREAIQRLDVNAGQHGSVVKSTAIGAALGALTGSAFTVDPNNCSQQSANFCSRGEAVGAGALTGAAVGALVGALHKTDRWLEVPSGSWKVSVQPAPRGIGGAVSVSF